MNRRKIAVTADCTSDLSDSLLDKYGIGRAMWSYKGMDFGLSDGLLSCITDKIV